MTTSKIIAIAFLIGLFSCTNNKTEKPKSETNTFAIDTNQANKSVAQRISDTIKKLIVDDYPVTNEMFSKQSVDNYSTYRKISGLTQSLDKAWFSNDTLNQILVFELYTDYHRLATYHFYNRDIPKDLIKQLELHTKDGEIAPEKQKLKDFQGFLNQATKINSIYFITNKGLKLGDKKQKAIDLFGAADKQTISDGFEELEWKFVGDNLYDGKENLKGKPLAQDSWGYQVTMFFKDNKLVGQILHNDIP